MWLFVLAPLGCARAENLSLKIKKRGLGINNQLMGHHSAAKRSKPPGNCESLLGVGSQWVGLFGLGSVRGACV